MLARLTAIIGGPIGEGEFRPRLNCMLSHHADAGKQAALHSHHPQCQVASIAAAVAHAPCQGPGLVTV